MKPACLLALTVLLALAARTAFSEESRAARKSRSGAHAIAHDLHDLKIGDAAPDFSLPGIDGKTHSLADYKDARLLLIVFISNHCPDSHAAQKRILQLAEEMKSQGLAVVAINPNNPEGLSIDELGYSKYSDGFEDMKMKVLDPSWPGAAPHTVLVGPSGNVIWSHNGPVDGDDRRAKVLEFIGSCYKP